VLFGADELEALSGCVELINTGRSRSAEGLAGLPEVRALAGRYSFHGRAGTPDDVPRLRALRARLDQAATACEAGDETAAINRLNELLAATGAVPQIAVHDGRGPHIHVSRDAAPLADRMVAHFAMGLAGLVVAGESGRVRSCASPSCRDVFVDYSRNRSRRYCDNRSCGNRVHVAAYRARRSARTPASPVAG
jgi:predicted RNA-binding Zn ribbon-like protein